MYVLVTCYRFYTLARYLKSNRGIDGQIILDKVLYPFGFYVSIKFKPQYMDTCLNVLVSDDPSNELSLI